MTNRITRAEEAVQAVVQSTDPCEALGQVILAIDKIKQVIADSHWTGDLLERLRDWIEKIRSAMENVANKLRAESFSVSVGAPLDMSVGITFSSELDQ